MGFRNPVTSAVDQTARDLANQALTQIIPGSRLAADAIDGKTITGATFQTAASGPRFTISGSNRASAIWNTGDPEEVSAGYLLVGMQTGTPNTADVGYLQFAPPQIGTPDPKSPRLVANSRSRDGTTSPGSWYLYGLLNIQDASTVRGLMSFGVRPQVQPMPGGGSAFQDVYGRDYIDAGDKAGAGGLQQLGRGSASYSGITTNAVEFAVVRVSVPLVANRLYHTAALCRAQSTVAGDTAGANIKLTRGTTQAPASSDVTIAAGTVPLTVAGINFPCVPDHWFTVSYSDTYQFSLWMSRPGGTGTMTATNGPMGDAHLSVVDHGTISAALNPNNVNNYTL